MEEGRDIKDQEGEEGEKGEKAPVAPRNGFWAAPALLPVL